MASSETPSTPSTNYSTLLDKVSVSMSSASMDTPSGSGKAPANPGLAAIADAVLTAAAVPLDPEPEKGLTWNGDINYTKVDDTFTGELVGFLNKLPHDEILAATKYQHSTKGKKGGTGSRREAQEARDTDFVARIPASARTKMELGMQRLFTIIKKTKGKHDRAIFLDMLIRSIFRSRAIMAGKRAKEGTGYRTISKFLWTRLYMEMPSTALATIPEFIHFGYFGDLHDLCAHYLKKGNNTVVDACVECFAQAYDSDCRQLFKNTAGEAAGFIPDNGPVLTHTEMREKFDKFSKKTHKMTPDQIKEQIAKKGITVSLAAKWGKSEGTWNSDARNILIGRLMCKGGFAEASKRGAGFLKFANMNIRWFETSIRAILQVPECYMAANRPEWIEPSKLGAGPTFKYKAYLLNKDLDEEEDCYQSTTGNRNPYDERFVALRERTLAAAVDGKIKGAGMDLVKFAHSICGRKDQSTPDIPDAATRTVMHAQFMHIVKDTEKILLTDYAEAIYKWLSTCGIFPPPTDEEDAAAQQKVVTDWVFAGESPDALKEWIAAGADPASKPSNPLYALAMVDVSGSMTWMHPPVYAPAIILGIVTALMSKLFRGVMSFSTTPSIHKLREDGDIFDWFQDIQRIGLGGSTNFDAANELLLKLMLKIKSSDPTFEGKVTGICFSDMQFNSANGTSYGSATAHQRLTEKFTVAGLSVPRWVYWNMNSKSPGFPAHGRQRGVILCEGLSQGLFLTALGNAVTYEVDAKTGASVAKVDPIEAFTKSICNAAFDRVSEIVFSTAEGEFFEPELCDYVRGFHAHWQR